MNVPTMVDERQIVDGHSIMEAVLLRGDLSKLTPSERNTYYSETCKSLGLNPFTQPFEYITLNGKLQLYGNRKCADQLRKLQGVSIKIISRELDGELLTVYVGATTADGRSDEDYGVVNIGKLQGEARANAILKCVTKAKRRVTMSICGLGFLDETEVEDIPAKAKDIVQPGDYDDGIPEKLTKPKQEPKHSRAEQAEIDWGKKFAEWKRIIRSFTLETDLRQWWNEKAPERSVFPPHMIRELRETADSQKDFIRSAMPQVVHDSDDADPRPATPEDFDPATGEIKDDPLDLIRA